MRRILAAVDRTSMAKAVVRQALLLAERFDGEVIVVHVFHEARLRSFLEVLDSTATYELYEIANRAEGVAERAAQPLKERGISHRIIGKVGAPSREIIQLTQSLKPDLLVIGFEGLHGPQRIHTLGSVARKVIEKVACPVLLVHKA